MTSNFCIYALGRDFDVDAYRATSAMVPTQIWYRGQPKAPGSDIVFPTSGIRYEIGDGHCVPHPDQEKLAAKFLAQHKQELKRLGDFPGVSYFNLGLELLRIFPRSTTGFTVSASPWLMQEALEVGCALTHYVSMRFEELEDPD